MPALPIRHYRAAIVLIAAAVVAILQAHRASAGPLDGAVIVDPTPGAAKVEAPLGGKPVVPPAGTGGKVPADKTAADKAAADKAVADKAAANKAAADKTAADETATTQPAATDPDPSQAYDDAIQAAADTYDICIKKAGSDKVTAEADCANKPITDALTAALAKLDTEAAACTAQADASKPASDPPSKAAVCTADVGKRKADAQAAADAAKVKPPPPSPAECTDKAAAANVAAVKSCTKAQSIAIRLAAATKVTALKDADDKAATVKAEADAKIAKKIADNKTYSAVRISRAAFGDFSKGQVCDASAYFIRLCHMAAVPGSTDTALMKDSEKAPKYCFIKRDDDGLKRYSGTDVCGYKPTPLGRPELIIQYSCEPLPVTPDAFKGPLPPPGGPQTVHFPAWTQWVRLTCDPSMRNFGQQSAFTK